MAKKEKKDPDDFEKALADLEAPDQRRTDSEVPAEEAAEKIRGAAADRRASRTSDFAQLGSKEMQGVEAHGLLEKVLSGEPMDFDSERRGRNETRAAAAARIAQARNAEYNEAVSLQDHEEYQYGLLCPHCGKVGCFFTANPMGRVLYNDDWFSALKQDTDTVWSMNMIPCQQCFIASGRYMGLAVNPAESKDPTRGSAFHVGGAFQRFVVKFAKDKERFAREGILDAYMDRARRIGREAEQEARTA